MIRRSWLFAWCVAGLWACTGPSGCACGGFTPLPQGSYSGPKLNTAGAARMSAQGFTTLNANATSILAFFAPGGVMQVPVPCSIQQTSLAGIPIVQLAIADTGTLGCASETCGRMNGACDPAIDVGQAVTLNFTSLTFAPKAPDILEAKVTATVSTGPIPISSRGQSASALCLFAGRAKFTVDLDTARAQPASTDLALDIKFAINTRWDELLSLEVANVGNAQACSGSVVPPNCIDPNDMEILNEGCGALNIASIGAVKSLLINQLTDSLKTQITDALAEANCATCGPAGECPSFDGGAGLATSTCEPDAGTCMDTMTGKCVPGLLGAEGRLEVGQALAALGAQPGAAIELSFGAGGSAEANPAGLTAGLRGGAKEVFVADCVAPATRPAPPMLALPDFDLDAPGPYDVGLSVSGQMISEVLFRAQQSGALCLELGQETVSALESGLLSTLLPSLGKLTGGQNVPLRIVIRPVNPPSAVVGEGTVDADGRPLDPLVRLNWSGVEIDAYALLDDRQARLFTVAADLSLPLGVTLDGCSGVTPVVGSLTGAITNVQVKNSEILAEPLTVLQNLVPSLLTLAEPQLAMGLTGFTLPQFNGFQLQLVGARGIGQVSGSSTYNHVAIYADLLSGGMMCKAKAKRASSELVRSAVKSKDSASLEAALGREYSWRVDKGFWSTWQKADALGRLQVQHPRLLLGGEHVIELRTPEGDVQQVVVR
ncbi:MAG: hypothetical protein Q8L48_26660 [Archangium sp.]|nr:hypothetical protein [Archangium sp.]